MSISHINVIFGMDPILHLYENIGYYRIDICSNYCAVLIFVLRLLGTVFILVSNGTKIIKSYHELP